MVNRNETNVEGAANEVQFLTAITCHIFTSNAIVNGQNLLSDRTTYKNSKHFYFQHTEIKTKTPLAQMVHITTVYCI